MEQIRYTYIIAAAYSNTCRHVYILLLLLLVGRCMSIAYSTQLDPIGSPLFRTSSSSLFLFGVFRVVLIVVFVFICRTPSEHI